MSFGAGEDSAEDKDFECPNGRGALRQFQSIVDAKLLAKQPGVSGPKITILVRWMMTGHWNWQAGEILKIAHADGDVIVDGHHRYIASLIAGIEPVMREVEIDTVRRTFKFADLYVDSRDWG